MSNRRIDRNTTVHTELPDLCIWLPASNAPSGLVFEPTSVSEYLSQGWPRWGYRVVFTGSLEDSYTDTVGSAIYGDRGWPLDRIPEALRPFLAGEDRLAGPYEDIGTLGTPAR